MKIVEILKQIKAKTWVSIVLVTISLLNYILTAMGKPIINLGENDVTYIVNTVMMLVSIGYSAWTNNSFTQKAQIADDLLFYLRDGKITKEELEEFINAHKPQQ